MKDFTAGLTVFVKEIVTCEKPEIKLSNLKIARQDIVLFEFPILSENKETDNRGWVMQGADGVRYILSTKNGSAITRSVDTLREMIAEYELALAQSKRALEIYDGEK